jgi:hypothetical protein
MLNIKENVLHQSAARYITGKDVKIEIKGAKVQLECFERLLKTSRALKETLDNDNNLDEVAALIEIKKQLTREFQDLTGITWRL